MKLSKLALFMLTPLVMAAKGNPTCCEVRPAKEPEKAALIDKTREEAKLVSKMGWYVKVGEYRKNGIHYSISVPEGTSESEVKRALDETALQNPTAEIQQSMM